MLIFQEISIKGRGSGEIYLVKINQKIDLKSEAYQHYPLVKFGFDPTIQRLNVEDRGDLLGEFQAEDRLLTINQKGEIQLLVTELSTHLMKI